MKLCMFGKSFKTQCMFFGIPGETMYVWEFPWETMYVWESLRETMYVWESLWKQCMFGNPLGNNVCLGIPGETMYVWESLGKQCMFGNP